MGYHGGVASGTQSQLTWPKLHHHTPSGPQGRLMEALGEGKKKQKKDLWVW